MKTIRAALGRRLSDGPLDARLGQLACYLGAVAVVPISVVALVRHPGSRADFLSGLGLTCLVGLLLATMGVLCRRMTGLQDRVSLRSRWPEFVSYAVCVGLLVLGVRQIAGLGLTPAQVTVGLLGSCRLSLAVLVLGMMTTVVGSPRG